MKNLHKKYGNEPKGVDSLFHVNIDTDVLVRYIADDNANDSARIANIFEDSGFKGYLTLIVLTETINVLQRVYKIDRVGIANVVRALLSHSRIEIENSDVVQDALTQYERTTKMGFNECLKVLMGYKLAGERVRTITLNTELQMGKGANRLPYIDWQ